MQLIGLAVVLAASLVLAPLAAEAQPAGKIYRIGYLSGKPQADTQEAIEHRYADGDFDRLQRLVEVTLKSRIRRPGWFN